MAWFAPTPTLADPLPVQLLTLRQGDRLSSFAMIIEDEYGTGLDLTDARCYLTLRPATPTLTEKMLERAELNIDDALTGQVSYDWQLNDTLETQPGNYDILIEVEYANGTVITVPSADQAATVALHLHQVGEVELWLTEERLGPLMLEFDHLP